MPPGPLLHRAGQVCLRGLPGAQAAGGSREPAAGRDAQTPANIC